MEHDKPIDSAGLPANIGARAGELDGIVLYRFAHIWRNASSGGVESYLDVLNRLLLARHAMSIVQSYLDNAPFEGEVVRELHGSGEIVWVPSRVRQPAERARRVGSRLRARLGLRAADDFEIDHTLLQKVLAREWPSLAVFHWISRDSRRIMERLRERSTPLAFVNHFQNTRLSLRDVRSQVASIEAIGGVSGTEVPPYLQSRFTSLSDGIDTDDFVPATCSSNDPSQQIILLPSRVSAEKGHLDAIEALPRVVRDCAGASLAVAGRVADQRYMSRLERATRELGLEDKVRFLGEVSATQLKEWYSRADLVVLPSHSEGMPRVVLEAQAMQCPVVAYDVGGVREALASNVSGVVVAKGDVAGLARGIIDLLSNPERRIAMGRAGRSYVKTEFSLANLVARHEAFYLAAMRGHRALPAA